MKMKVISLILLGVLMGCSVLPRHKAERSVAAAADYNLEQITLKVRGREATINGEHIEKLLKEFRSGTKPERVENIHFKRRPVWEINPVYQIRKKVSNEPHIYRGVIFDATFEDGFSYTGIYCKVTVMFRKNSRNTNLVLENCGNDEMRFSNEWIQATFGELDITTKVDSRKSY